jgi:aminoglycoside phosphotransferase (APT) family kinase protein
MSKPVRITIVNVGYRSTNYWVVSAGTPRYEGPLRFIHHDLSPERLVVDSKTGRLAGILDWTDSILGDSARDFVFLVTWRGWDFTEEVLHSYRLPLDGVLEKG